MKISVIVAYLLLFDRVWNLHYPEKQCHLAMLYILKKQDFYEFRNCVELRQHIATTAFSSKAAITKSNSLHSYNNIKVFKIHRQLTV